MSFVRNFGRVRIATNHHLRALLACAGASLLGFTACFSSTDGIPPPLDVFYYPTALVVSPGRTTLYVANSDFDLQYSGGTLQALDLEMLRKDTRALRVALNDSAAMDPPPPDMSGACSKPLGLSINDNTALYPGPCSPVTVAKYIKNSVVIGAFSSAAGLALHPRPCEEGRGARLFVTVRGDPSVTYVDVTDDRELSCDSAPVAPCKDTLGCLSCGAETNDGRCSSSYLVGRDPSKSTRELTLPVDPYGMDIDDRGEAIVVAHQTEQTASLIVNDWVKGPALQYYTASLSPGPTDIASLPIPLLVAENRQRADACKAMVPAPPTGEKRMDYTPAFVVSYRSSPEFTLLRYDDDAESNPPRPFLTRGLSAGIATVASSTDSRGVAIDATERQACEKTCGQTDRAACLRACAENVPLGVYMANRLPAALVIGRIETKFTEDLDENGELQVTGGYELPAFHDSVPLAFGSSRVELGKVIDKDGNIATRIFAVTFDSRFVFSYDPKERRVDAIVRTGRGPHAITFDSGEEVGEDGQKHAYATMYISHFTDSYLGVVDLDMRNRTTFGSIYMTLGKPVPPKGSQ